MDINTDPCCRKATDPGLALGSSKGADITMGSGGSADPSHRAIPRSFRVSRSASLHSAHTTSLSIPSLHHMLAHHSGTHPCPHRGGTGRASVASDCLVAVSLTNTAGLSLSLLATRR